MAKVTPTQLAPQKPSKDSTWWIWVGFLLVVIAGLVTVAWPELRDDRSSPRSNATPPPTQASPTRATPAQASQSPNAQP